MFGRLFKNTQIPKTSRRRSGFRLNVEALEHRLVPAVNVFLDVSQNTTTGIVSIKEDASNKDVEEGISITEGATTGSYTLTGLTSLGTANTTEFVIVGKGNFTPATAVQADNITSIVVTGVTGFSINMGGVADSTKEADQVLLIGDGLASTSLSGDMDISATPAIGADKAALDVQNSTGAANNFNITGGLNITVGGTGSLLGVGLTGTDTYGSISISGSDGGTGLAVADKGISIGGGAAASEIFGNLAITFKGGTNDIALGDPAGATATPVTAATAGLTIDGSLSYNGAGKTAVNSVFLGDTTTGSDFTYTGAGKNTVTIEGASKISGNFSSTDTGDDTYLITDTTEITGYVSLNTSGTGNGLVFTLTGTAKLDDFLSLVDTGSGANTYMIIGASSVASNFAFESGTGALILTIASAPATGPVIGGNVNQVASKVTTEAVTITGNATNTQVAGYVSLYAPAATGAFTVIIDGGGAGAASVPTIGGYLSVVSGKGNDTLDIKDTAYIGSNVGWNTGAGSSVITIEGASEVAGDVFENPLLFTGPGATTDTFLLESGAFTDGWVSINNSAATKVTVTIDGTGLPSGTDAIAGFLSVVGGGTDNILIDNGAAIGSAFAWFLGNGNSTIETDDAVLNGPVWGTFGSGSDKLLLGELGTTTMGSSLGVLMGAGNDSVDLGGGGAGSLVFTSTTAPAILSASSGTNTVNQHFTPGTSTPTSVTYGFTTQLELFGTWTQK